MKLSRRNRVMYAFDLWETGLYKRKFIFVIFLSWWEPSLWDYALHQRFELTGNKMSRYQMLNTTTEPSAKCLFTSFLFGQSSSVNSEDIVSRRNCYHQLLEQIRPKPAVWITLGTRGLFFFVAKLRFWSPKPRSISRREWERKTKPSGRGSYKPQFYASLGRSLVFFPSARSFRVKTI